MMQNDVLGYVLQGYNNLSRLGRLTEWDRDDRDPVRRLAAFLDLGPDDTKKW